MMSSNGWPRCYRRCLLLGMGIGWMLTVSAIQIPFRVMSYNVENLFDTVDDPERADEDFLPEGTYHWHPKRYYHKLRQVAKVILAAGEWDTPALVGLCEVENDTVLHHLTTRTPLRSQQYRYCRADRSDRRGINVALLYQPDKFRYLSHQSWEVRFSRAKHKQTRQILQVSGLIASGDTLDVFVCHFPSRSGGEKETEPDRLDAAWTVRQLADSLQSVRQHPLLLVMGDFNDTPADRSIAQVLTSHTLQPLLDVTKAHSINGTHKYQGTWSQLDHLFVHPSMLDKSASMQLVEASPRLFAPAFLLKKETNGSGMRPFRTYMGYRYEGGFSDHLPILADFVIDAVIRESEDKEE